MVVDAVTDRYHPLQFDQEKLAGLLSMRMQANSEGYLEHVDEHLLAHSLQNRGGDARTASVGGQAGKFLEASANAYAYSHDAGLRAVMERVEKQLIAAQTGDSGSVSKSGAGNSALWVQKYDLLGLLAYYRVTQDDSALDASENIGDSLVKTFAKGSSGYSENARAMVLVEAFVALYRYTEESRYLDLCRSAAEAWLRSKDTHSGPSYENLSALQGLVELYRVTGDESYFRPVVAAWMDVRNKWLSPAGNPTSNGEASTANRNRSEGDACATLTWIQLTLNLLRVTGEAQYAEQLEHTIYNQLFATQEANTGAILASAPLNGSKQRSVNSDACMSSEAEGLTLIPSMVWGRYGNGIAVLLYNAGRATFQLSRRGSVQLYSEAAYPESGDFLLHVEPAHNMRFPLRLRVPEWTSHFAVEIAGSHLMGRPGDFLTINREWKRGDTVKISMDMTVRVLTGSSTYADQIALQRGPQVMALCRALNPQLKDLAGAALIDSDASRPRLTPVDGKLPLNWPGDQAYAVAGEYEGKPQRLVLVPFADANAYRVWMKRPAASSGGATE